MYRESLDGVTMLLQRCIEPSTGTLQELQPSGDVEFCITSSGFQVARTATGHDLVARGAVHKLQQPSTHPHMHRCERPDSPPPLTNQLDGPGPATHAAAAQHRKDYLLSACFNAWHMWTAGTTLCHHSITVC